MLTSNTAILWGDDTVLTRSIEMLITAEKGWKVVTVCNSELPAWLIDAIENLDPKVVIINQGNDSNFSSDEIDLFLRLIQKHSGTKVITVSLASNAMEVYKRQNVCITDIRDLLSVLEG